MLVIGHALVLLVLRQKGPGLSSREQEQRERTKGEQAAHQLHDSVSRS